MPEPSDKPETVAPVEKPVEAKPAPKPVTPSFNQKAWAEKLSRLEACKTEQAGKPNYNPFLFFGLKVVPLTTRYAKGERTPELFNAMMALPDTIPSLGLDGKE